MSDEELSAPHYCYPAERSLNEPVSDSQCILARDGVAARVGFPEGGSAITTTRAQNVNSGKAHYVIAALLGAIGGGLAVALATRAIPKMLSRMMPGMMRGMMAQTGQGTCEPAEM